MSELNWEIVTHLQEMARGAGTAAQILRDLNRRLTPEEAHPLTLIKYLRKAFHLTLQEASPIAGWSVADPGELSDSQLNSLVDPEIRKHQDEWNGHQPGQGNRLPRCG